MNTQNFTEVTIEELTDEEYRKYDTVIGEIISHIVEETDKNGVLRLQAFNRKNKEHMLVYHVAQMMRGIYNYELQLDCSWWDRLIINHKHRKIFEKVVKAPDYSIDGIWVDELVDWLHVKLDYSFNFAEIYEAYYEGSIK
jgi:hypothetical protein